MDATRFEAVVFDSGDYGSAATGFGEALRCRCDALRAAGVLVHDVDSDDTGAISELAAGLAARGITGRLIALVGAKLAANANVPELRRAVVAPTPDGRDGVVSLIRLLDRQLQLRADRRVPTIDDDPAWVVRLPEDPVMERAAEALGTLANGWAGVRGRREDGRPAAVPAMVVNGVYTDVDGQGAFARCAGLDSPDGRRCGRRRTACRSALGPPTASAVDMSGRFASCRRRGAMRWHCAPRGVPRSWATQPSWRRLTPLLRSSSSRRQTTRERGHVRLQAAESLSPYTTTTTSSGSAASSNDWRLWQQTSGTSPQWDRVTEQLGELVSAGFDRLLADHRTAWAQRWATARVDIEGCPGDELAARFAVFHLLASALGDGEVAVGARGLSGPAYGGHVFWDADVFVLPALAAIHPAAARAMLEYRIRRLPAARQAAQESGFAGARFPWESATTGRDVTPRQFVGKSGDVIQIRTGELEEHIVADVAWAASEYAAWTGDTGFLRGPGADLVLDTARYWASRVTIEPDGRGHVRGVIGPDEYHEVVDDNAFTNVMARWNLRRGADLADELGRGDEAARWRQLASNMVDGWDADRRLYEQFAGYWALEPLLIDQVADPPFAADVLLGAARVRGSQLIKQADVVLLHHLVPGEVEDWIAEDQLGLLRATHRARQLAVTGDPRRPARPRRRARSRRSCRSASPPGSTSTISPAPPPVVCISPRWAGSGRRWRTGSAGSVPAATCCTSTRGCRASGRRSPCTSCFVASPVVIRAEHDRVVIDCAAPLTVRIGGAEPQSCPPPGQAFTIADGRRRERRTR